MMATRALVLFNLVCWENGACSILGAVFCASITSFMHSHPVSFTHICRGEWHTWDTGLISKSTRDAVVGWYASAFKTTKLQCRWAVGSAYAAGMGLHDDSFASATLDGAANGNVTVDWFFYPTVQGPGFTDFWTRGVMGGETRPELQATIFTPGYPAGTPDHQDFLLCVKVTHASYMVNFAAFQNTGYNGTTLVNAQRAHARMGYNFQITNVAVTSLSAGSVGVDVTVMQTGVAPFYYPLSLVLSCPTTTQTVGGVNGLIQNGDSKVFSFIGIPADSTCLNAITMTLVSEYASAGRPVKFAQGSSGTVTFGLPLPPATVSAPTPLAVPNPPPVTVPAPSPVTVPAPSPVTVPAPSPVTVPAPSPVAVPAPSPVATPLSSPFFASASTQPNGSRFTIAGSTNYYSTSASILGTASYAGSLYKNSLWSYSSFTYNIAGFAPESANTVTLGFAETYTPFCQKNHRLFNVLANNSPLVSNLDMYVMAGGCNKAYTPTYTVSAKTDGTISLTFEPAAAGSPTVSFIDIKSL
jgi:hypothetical protein